MSKTFRIWWIGLCLLFMALPVSAQKFFNLTSDEVKVDSVLPQFLSLIHISEPTRPVITSRMPSSA